MRVPQAASVEHERVHVPQTHVNPSAPHSRSFEQAASQCVSLPTCGPALPEQPELTAMIQQFKSAPQNPRVVNAFGRARAT
jgi:hypothetical protein